MEGGGWRVVRLCGGTGKGGGRSEGVRRVKAGVRLWKGLRGRRDWANSWVEGGRWRVEFREAERERAM